MLSAAKCRLHICRIAQFMRWEHLPSQAVHMAHMDPGWTGIPVHRNELKCTLSGSILVHAAFLSSERVVTGEGVRRRHVGPFG